MAKAPIFNGADAAGLASGAVWVSANGNCSGVIVNQYWVVTAAHCFAASQDLDNDGVITLSEGANQTVVINGPDANGNPINLSAYAIYKHPNSFWETPPPGATDVALVFVDPNSSGFSVGTLNASFYTSGFINVFQGDVASVVGSGLLAIGIGPTGPGWIGSGVQHYGWKVLTSSSDPRFYMATLGDNGGYLAGTTCHGDSGGPDYYWDGGKFNLIGIHSILSDEDCTGQDGLAADWNDAAGAFRDWMGSMVTSWPALQWSSWETIPGATGRAVGAATFDSELYLFASGNVSTDYIYFNHAGANQPFVGWDTVGGASDTPLAAVQFGTLLYLFTRGDGGDHNAYYNVLVPGQGFIGWGSTGGVVGSGLAAAVFQDEIYFFAKGDGADNGIYFNSASWQQPWNGWRSVGGATDASLVATAFDDKLYLFARGAGSNQYYANIATTPDSFPGWGPIPSVLDVTTGVVPTGALATAVFNGRLYLFARGTDNLIYFSSAPPGVSFGGWLPVPGGVSTDAAPAVVSFNDNLWVVAKDTSNAIRYTKATAF